MNRNYKRLDYSDGMTDMERRPIERAQRLLVGDQKAGCDPKKPINHM